jgi:Ran GTPase-activating protein (RanGAP) involved in mRNA processing and transport
MYMHIACNHVRQQMLMHCGTQRLELAWNGIEDKGTAAMFDALASNTTLKHLDVSSTRMTSIACANLAAMLRKNSALESVNVSGNVLEAEGERMLVRALADNRSLHQLAMGVSPISICAEP